MEDIFLLFLPPNILTYSDTFHLDEGIVLVRKAIIDLWPYFKYVKFFVFIRDVLVKPLDVVIHQDNIIETNSELQLHMKAHRRWT